MKKIVVIGTNEKAREFIADLKSDMKIDVADATRRLGFINAIIPASEVSQEIKVCVISGSGLENIDVHAKETDAYLLLNQVSELAKNLQEHVNSTDKRVIKYEKSHQQNLTEYLKELVVNPTPKMTPYTVASQLTDKDLNRTIKSNASYLSWKQYHSQQKLPFNVEGSMSLFFKSLVNIDIDNHKFEKRNEFAKTVKGGPQTWQNENPEEDPYSQIIHPL